MTGGVAESRKCRRVQLCAAQLSPREHYLVLISLYLSQSKFFGDNFADGWAGGEEMSMRHKRQLALHEILFEFSDECFT